MWDYVRKAQSNPIPNWVHKKAPNVEGGGAAIFSLESQLRNLVQDETKRQVWDLNGQLQEVAISKASSARLQKKNYGPHFLPAAQYLFLEFEKNGIEKPNLEKTEIFRKQKTVWKKAQFVLNF